MTTELSRTATDEPNVSIITRVKDGQWQAVREVRVSTGEETDQENELLTTETITITRRIGITTGF